MSKQRYATLDEVMSPEGGMILMKEPRRKTGNGKAATKTLTQMVKEAEAAREGAREERVAACEHARAAEATEKRMGDVLRAGTWFISALFCVNFLVSVVMWVVWVWLN